MYAFYGNWFDQRDENLCVSSTQAIVINLSVSSNICICIYTIDMYKSYSLSLGDVRICMYTYTYIGRKRMSKTLLPFLLLNPIETVPTQTLLILIYQDPRYDQEESVFPRQRAEALEATIRGQWSHVAYSLLNESVTSVCIDRLQSRLAPKQNTVDCVKSTAEQERMRSKEVEGYTDDNLLVTVLSKHLSSPLYHISFAAIRRCIRN